MSKIKRSSLLVFMIRHTSSCLMTGSGRPGLDFLIVPFPPCPRLPDWNLNWFPHAERIGQLTVEIISILWILIQVNPGSRRHRPLQWWTAAFCSQALIMRKSFVIEFFINLNTYLYADDVDHFGCSVIQFNNGPRNDSGNVISPWQLWYPVECFHSLESL